MTDIIDRIDDVLTDWHGSADSMHWTADPDAPTATGGEVVLGFDGAGTDGDVVAVRHLGGRVVLLPAGDPAAFERRIQEIVRSWAPALNQFAEAVRLAWGQVAHGLASLARHLQAVAPKRKGYQHQPFLQFARPRALPIDGHAYHRRRRTR